MPGFSFALPARFSRLLRGGATLGVLFLLAATAPDEAADQVYYVAFGERTSLNELFALIRERVADRVPAARDAEPVYRDFRAGDVRHSQADIGKALRLLGYAPTHDLRAGLAEAVGWYAMRFAPAAAPG